MKVSSHILSRCSFPAVIQVIVNHCTLGFVDFKTGLIAFVKTPLAHAENRTTGPWSSITLSSPNVKYAIQYSRSYWGQTGTKVQVIFYRNDNLISELSGNSATRIPLWYGNFGAKYSPVFLTEISI
jgi:hypothetical protein